MRSMDTSHACKSQDMWKGKSARPRTSVKAGYIRRYLLSVESIFKINKPKPVTSGWS